MLSLARPLYLVLAIPMIAGGCTGGPDAVVAPDVDPAEAVSAALQAYDANGDKALSGDELAQIPAIATFLPEYDKDGDKSVSEQELTDRFSRLFAIPGFSKLNCLVLFNGRPLSGAEVVFEPEPFLGDDFKTARGTTGAQGSTQIAIPNDQLPEANQRLGGGVYIGLYKVSITHPSTKLPEAYQGDNTVLGHEVSSMTSAGANARFQLDAKGTKPY
jgi:hypothetical protein